jgi:tetratricopeptide (TPR) repeat protein
MEPSPASEVQARVERLLRDAHLHRMRQQWAAAETLCREALELSPEDPMGQEMLADLLAEKGSLDEALELYHQAFEQQPQKASLETKIARVVLQKDEELRERLAVEALINSPASKAHRKRNAIIAVLLSLLCPGAGQLFNGQYVKGGILLVVGLLAFAFGAPHLFTMILVLSGIRLPRGTAPPDQMLTMLGLMGVLVWIYGLLDASAQAGKPRKGLDD